MNWYVVYTKPRWEKKVFGLLQTNDIQSFLPTRCIWKQYVDRRKKVDEIVLPSYLFVQANEKDLATIRRIDGVLNFIYWLGKPAIIKNKDVDIFRKFLLQDGELIVEKTSMIVGSKIKIDGNDATILKITRNKTVLMLDSLQIKLILNTKKISNG